MNKTAKKAPEWYEAAFYVSQNTWFQGITENVENIWLVVV